MKSTLARHALTAAKFAIPALIIGYLLWRIEPEEWSALGERPKNYPLLAVALLVAVVALCLSFVRWCLLVRAQGIRLSMLEAFRLGSIGFLLSFVSAGSVGGDLFKAIFLARRRPGKRLEAVASVVVDRGCGLYGLLLLVAMALFLSGRYGGEGVVSDELRGITTATVALVGVGTLGIVLLIWGGRSVDRFIQRASKWPWIGGLIGRIGGPLRMFHERPMAFLSAVILSVGVQGMLAVSMFLVARSLYELPPTLPEHFVIVPVGMLASALPIAPAGLGVLEATVEWLYRIIPAQSTEASGTIVALVFEIVKLVIAVLGTVFYWTAGDEVRASLEQAEIESGRGAEAAASGVEQES